MLSRDEIEPVTMSKIKSLVGQELDSTLERNHPGLMNLVKNTALDLAIIIPVEALESQGIPQMITDIFLQAQELATILVLSRAIFQVGPVPLSSGHPTCSPLSSEDALHSAETPSGNITASLNEVIVVVPFLKKFGRADGTNFDAVTELCPEEVFEHAPAEADSGADVQVFDQQPPVTHGDEVLPGASVAWPQTVIGYGASPSTVSEEEKPAVACGDTSPPGSETAPRSGVRQTDNMAGGSPASSISLVNSAQHHIENTKQVKPEVYEDDKGRQIVDMRD